MPNIEKAVVQDQKIRYYLLKDAHGKANVFKSAFGIDIGDEDFFADGLIKGLQNGKIVKAEKTEYGQKFTVTIEFTGKNDHTEHITTSWQYDNGSNLPRFITAILRGKRGKK